MRVPTPRRAGVALMILGLVVSIVAGGLIADPPVSILGAVVLVAGTILVAVGASWTLRKNWSASSWPESRYSDDGVPIETIRRRLRRWVLLQCVLAPLLIGSGVWQAVTSGVGWVNIVWGAFLLLSATSQLRRFSKAVGGGGAADEAASTDDQTDLPRGTPRTWYRIAGLGAILAVGCPALTGAGLGGGETLGGALATFGALGILAVLLGLGIAVTKEREITDGRRAREPDEGA